MADYNSDDDSSYNSDYWDNDVEAESSSAPALRSHDTPGPSTLVPQDADGRANGAASLSHSIENCVAMGFSKELVLKGIKNMSTTSGNSVIDPNQLIELLLTLKELGDDLLVVNRSISGCTPEIVKDEDDSEGWDDENEVEDFLQDTPQRDNKIQKLVQMGFPEDEAKMAITRCGFDSAMSVLVDSIYASQANRDEHEIKNNNFIDSCMERKKSKLVKDCRKRKRFERGGGRLPSWDHNHDDLMRVPSPMKGFSLPTERAPSLNRRIPKEAIGPPYFYYQDVASTPKGIWDRIVTSLDNIVPEFLDSKYLSAVAMERGYAHNLPADCRSPLLPLRSKTIFGLFPSTKACWPFWDKRTQFNSLQSCRATPKVLEHIYHLLAHYDGIPPPSIQKYVMEECSTWNLIWVGKNRAVRLEPQEMEDLLGFPRNYTRGFTTTDRYKSLGDAVQIDTVAYHFSVLKDRFPAGMNVLSVYTGIGGCVVALDKLGIRIKTVVSVETSEVSRKIFRRWWEGTQSGKLVEINDAQKLSHDAVIELTRKHGDFDLIIGCNACNNSPGSAEYDRKHSSLFDEYVRILKAVRSV